MIQVISNLDVYLDIEVLATEPGAYGEGTLCLLSSTKHRNQGSYVGAGHLLSAINTTGVVHNYGRWLDLDQGIARTSWTQSGSNYTRYGLLVLKMNQTDFISYRSTFCSHPSQSCTQHIKSSSTMPTLSYSFSSALEHGLPIPDITCHDSRTLRIRGFADIPGMVYEILARVSVTASTGSLNVVKCIQIPVPFGVPPNATIQVEGFVVREAWISWVGGTEYSVDAGDADHDFSFRGADPHNALIRLLNPPFTDIVSYARSLAQHVEDYKTALTDKFSLSLGQIPRLDVPTDVIKTEYKTDVGDPYLEWLIFNYGRYLLVSSGRGVLPANLQGKWANGKVNAWSSGKNLLPSLFVLYHTQTDFHF